MTVGESIRFYREKQGLSMEELGRKLQVSQQTVALWETDKTLPTAENLLRLREIFGVPVDAILTASVVISLFKPWNDSSGIKSA